MGSKLNLLGIVFFVLVFSCKSVIKNQGNDFFVKKEDYIKAYKTAFVCGCLNQGTKGNFYKFLKDNNDLGLFTEGDLISHSKVKEADSLGRKYSIQITPFTYGDGKDKIPIFSKCMLFAFNTEVDSIANVSYKKYMGNMLKK